MLIGHKNQGDSDQPAGAGQGHLPMAAFLLFTFRRQLGSGKPKGDGSYCPFHTRHDKIH